MLKRITAREILSYPAQTRSWVGEPLSEERYWALLNAFLALQSVTEISDLLPEVAHHAQ